MGDMSITPINNLSASYLQAILGTTLQNSDLSNTTLSGQPDSSWLSPFAQMATQLQQLQQSDPSKYQQVTQQIATNLQKAAQTEQAQGNTAAANQLNQLATDFTDASKSGQLPNFQDLAQASAHHHGHHHHHASAGSGSSSTSQTQDPTQAFFPATDRPQNDSLNPIGIIRSTLDQARATPSAS